jgi:hypothetical protein
MHLKTNTNSFRKYCFGIETVATKPKANIRNVVFVLSIICTSGKSQKEYG